jgi:hypothetical protein
MQLPLAESHLRVKSGLTTASCAALPHDAVPKNRQFFDFAAATAYNAAPFSAYSAKACPRT